MAAPLDIIKVPKNARGWKLKVSCASLRQGSPPHPLESGHTEELFSDSEPESVLDSPCSESVSSIATSNTSCDCQTAASCLPLTAASFRSGSLMPVVLTSSAAAYTPRVPSKPGVFSSKLTELLQKADTLAAGTMHAQAKAAYTYQIPEVSRLSPWQAFLAFFISYSMRSGSQKDSGERFPEIASINHDSTSPAVASEGRELDTFAEHEPEHCEPIFHKSKARNREYRVNSEFLKRYAIDCNARLKGVLPIIPEDVALIACRPSLRKFDREHGLNKVSEMSRDKLWNSVILPPRKDSCPRSVIDFESYELSSDCPKVPSIISRCSSKLPWATHQSSIKPAGRLRTSACVKSKTSPTLGHSIPQYTVRGWQNPRWVSH